MIWHKKWDVIPTSCGAALTGLRPRGSYRFRCTADRTAARMSEGGAKFGITWVVVPTLPRGWSDIGYTDR